MDRIPETAPSTKNEGGSPAKTIRGQMAPEWGEERVNLVPYKFSYPLYKMQSSTHHILYSESYTLMRYNEWTKLK